MIVGLKQKKVDSDKVWDYSACLYPEGILDPEKLYLFDNLYGHYRVTLIVGRVNEYTCLAVCHGSYQAACAYGSYRRILADVDQLTCVKGCGNYRGRKLIARFSVYLDLSLRQLNGIAVDTAGDLDEDIGTVQKITRTTW